MAVGTLVLIVAALADFGANASNPEVVCGFHCLDVVARAFDRDLSRLEPSLGEPTSEGYTLDDIGRAAEAMGLKTLLVKTSVGNLQRRPHPFLVIAHVDDASHFIVLGDVDASQNVATIFDPRELEPSRGLSRIDLAVLDARWDGVALLISPKPLIREEDLPWSARTWAQLSVGTAAVLAIGVWATWHAVRRRT